MLRNAGESSKSQRVQSSKLLLRVPSSQCPFTTKVAKRQLQTTRFPTKATSADNASFQSARYKCSEVTGKISHWTPHSLAPPIWTSTAHFLAPLSRPVADFGGDRHRNSLIARAPVAFFVLKPVSITLICGLHCIYTLIHA